MVDIEDEPVYRITSKFGFEKTFEILKNELKEKGFKIFCEIDHESAAKDSGTEMFPAKVILFGKPEGGTQLMNAEPEIALDLPARMLIYYTGETEVVFKKLENIVKEHNLLNFQETAKKFDLNVNNILNSVG